MVLDALPTDVAVWMECPDADQQKDVFLQCPDWVAVDLDVAELRLLVEVGPSLVQLLIGAALEVVGDFHPPALLHDEPIADLEDHPLLC